jgi:hypothetical protein
MERECASSSRIMVWFGVALASKVLFDGVSVFSLQYVQAEY